LVGWGEGEGGEVSVYNLTAGQGIVISKRRSTGLCMVDSMS
jgi:hypothetical protein